MKKLKITIIASLALLMGATSCSESFDEVRRETSAGGDDVIGAQLESLAGDQARLTLSTQDKTTGQYDMIWTKGDEIAVIGTKTAKFTLVDSTAKKASGRFSGNLADAGEGPYYAVFPYNENARVADGAIKFAIPQTVDGQNNNVSANAIPCVARVGTDGGLQYAGMHNVTGLLKITLKSSKSPVVKKMTLHDLGGNMLWGDCTVPVLEGGEPDYENIVLSGGTNSLSMLWDGTKSVTISSTAKSFLFPVPPGALDRGFSLVIYKKNAKTGEIGDTYTFIQKITNPVAAQRSYVIDMDAMTITEKSESSDVARRGYYKSLFVDAGMYLNNNFKTSGTGSIPAIAYLGLEDDYEYFASHSTGEIKGDIIKQDSIVQQSIFVASPQDLGADWNDANGVLLYPDGSPRFRMMYVNGGTSSSHGKSLRPTGCLLVHDYFYNGGSYAGSCAGAFIASKYVDGSNRYAKGNTTSYSFGICPGDMVSTHLPPSTTTYPSVYTGMKFLPKMKELFSGYSYNVKDTIEDVRHHGGGYLPHNAKTKGHAYEELFTYQYSGAGSHEKDTSRYNPANSGMKKFQYSGKFINIVDSVGAWAYKFDDVSGRAVCTGSHPEAASSGMMRDFTATMLRYAMDGNGKPKVKQPDLVMGKTRTMDKKTSDNNPEYTGIGDLQYHHFKFTTAQSVKNFRLSLSSKYDENSGIDLYLSLRKGGLAWLSDADYVICTKGGNKELLIKELPAGEWYVGVYCATTVKAETTYQVTSAPYYFKYSGKTEVLDGIPYAVSTGISE